MEALTHDYAERFWAKVNKNTPGGCWEWTGFCLPGGYGRVYVPRRAKRHDYAHRIAFEIAHGSPAQQWVLHSCDNPRCCNPEHLRDGSPKENAADRHERRGEFWRQQYAEGRRKRKEKVQRIAMEMFALACQGVSRTWLQVSFGYSESSVRRLLQEGEKAWGLS